MSEPILALEGLKVVRPDGVPLFDGLKLEVHAGEVVAIMGVSGSGKSTLGRVLFAPDELKSQGYWIHAEHKRIGENIGIVPQNGALFDHLDVPGNLELALRYSDNGRGHKSEVIGWLESVGLDMSFARPGIPVSSLSGGQAQRLAVARTLAGGRRLLFLDEPSGGLDPANMRILGQQIRRQVEEKGAGCLVVTHDVALVTAVADRVLFLDTKERRLVSLFDDREWPGAKEMRGVEEDTRSLWQGWLEKKVIERIELSGNLAAGAHQHGFLSGLRNVVEAILRPFRMAGGALASGGVQLMARPADFSGIFGRVLGQALLRPFVFFAVVSTLLGYTVLYVIARVSRDLSIESAVQFIGSSHIVALVPPVASFLFVAASGNPVNAWLGGMSLRGQMIALESLGIGRRRYLDGPAWLALGLSSLSVSLLFALGMALGGWLFCMTNQVSEGWALLTDELWDPRPERVAYLVRAGWLVFLYAWGIASDSLASGVTDKRAGEHVTRSMTGSVVRCTLWIVILEFLSALILFQVQDP